MGILERLGLIETTVVAAPVPETREGAIVPPARPTGTSVTVDTALTIPAVYRSIQIIQTVVGSMTMEVHRGTTIIDPPPIVKRPSVNDTPQGFVEDTVFSLAAHGEAFWRIYRPQGDYAQVANIEVLDPATIVVEAVLDRDGLDTGRRRYLLGGRQVPASTIKHLKLMRRPGKVHGLGPIQAGTAELRGALALRDFASSWFDVSGVPTGVLTTDLVLGPAEAKAFAEAWKEFLRTTGGTAVLSQGLHYEPVHIKPAEAQFLEVQQAVVTSIARLFGIPANFLLAEITGNAMTYQNIQQTHLQFLQTTLSRYMNEIENAFSDLLPRGQTVNFNEESLMRLDTKALWDVRAIQIEQGYTTAAELREADGKDPLPATTQDEEVPA